MQEMQSRLWPLGMHPGGLGWSLARGPFASTVALWSDEGRLVAWAGIDHPDELLAQVEPGEDEAAEAVMAWFLAGSPGAELRIPLTDSETTLRAAAVRRGFEDSGKATYGLWMDAVPRPHVAGEYPVRAVQPEEAARRVEVHRAAWKPSELPWSPGHGPVTDPEATSSFDQAAYAACRRTWLYDADFDLVAVAPDGTFAASCLAWFDPSTGVAEIEPLGVHPAHRRRGLAGLLCHEVARRVAERGGSEVFINSGPNEGYPAPPGAYAKAGFRIVKRGTVYVRPR